LSNRRSLLALDNLIAAVRFALEDARAVNDTFIVADPKATSVAELVATLRSATGREPRLVPVPTRLLSKILDLVGKREMFERLGGTLVAQPRKLMAAGWRPVIDTETAVAQMVQAASPRKSGTASRSTP
jgi:UDP-glucose 4-epimerase